MSDPVTLELGALDRIRVMLDHAGSIDFTELMIEGARILQEDNERYLLDGLDCDGRSMPATWRERNPEGFWFTRGTGPGRKRIHVLGGQEAGYGPPLIPHREQSRAIRNAQVGWTTAEPWMSMLTWVGFDSDDGRAILGLHAHPGPGAPYQRRDIVSHPRPETITRFVNALDLFVRSQLRP